jgi:hypothetical protein
MTGQIVCPRCGARNSFIEGYLPETCVCLRCQSQLDWREIPGCGPDCKAAMPEATEPGSETPQSESGATQSGSGTTATGDETPARGAADL